MSEEMKWFHKVNYVAIKMVNGEDFHVDADQIRQIARLKGWVALEQHLDKVLQFPRPPMSN